MTYGCIHGPSEGGVRVDEASKERIQSGIDIVSLEGENLLCARFEAGDAPSMG